MQIITKWIDHSNDWQKVRERRVKKKRRSVLNANNNKHKPPKMTLNLYDVLLSDDGCNPVTLNISVAGSPKNPKPLSIVVLEVENFHKIQEKIETIIMLKRSLIK